MFNFDNVFFFSIYCRFIKICSSHWVSVTKESLVWPQKGYTKKHLFVTNQWFLCLTDSVRQTSSEKMAKNCKKVDIVKNGNHCSKKIWLGYLLSKLCGFNKRKDLRLKDEIRVTSEKTYFNLQFSIVLLTKKTITISFSYQKHFPFTVCGKFQVCIVGKHCQLSVYFLSTLITRWSDILMTEPWFSDVMMD